MILFSILAPDLLQQIKNYSNPESIFLFSFSALDLLLPLSIWGRLSDCGAISDSLQSANSLRIKIRWNLYRVLGTNYRDGAQGKYLQFTITAIMVMVTGEQLGEPASGDQHHQGAITLSQQTALHWPLTSWL